MIINVKRNCSYITKAKERVSQGRWEVNVNSNIKLKGWNLYKDLMKMMELINKVVISRHQEIEEWFSHKCASESPGAGVKTQIARLWYKVTDLVCQYRHKSLHFLMFPERILGTNWKIRGDKSFAWTTHLTNKRCSFF